MEKAKKILNTLNRYGFETYIVGGAVRDMSMGLSPNDIDITTSATPEEVISIFSKTYPSGIEFGTVTVIIDGEDFEVTTFRTDGEYLDGRRPEVVVFGKSIEEDLSRRDFTINAMAMDVNGKIVDLFGGQDDLEKGIIKAVGNPVQRFSEDALRILRAFRFSGRYGFEIETETLRAIKETKEGLKLISTERIRDELTKILLTDNATKTFELMKKIEILSILLTNKKLNTKAIKYAPKNALLKWATLLSNLDIVTIEVISNKLKFSNDFKNKLLETLKFANMSINPTPKEIRIVLHQLQHTNLENILVVKEAMLRAQNQDIETLNQIRNLAKNEEKITIRDLKVNGNDLIKLGLKGKEIGNMLDYLLDLVLDNPTLNKKETLLNISTTKFTL